MPNITDIDQTKLHKILERIKGALSNCEKIDQCSDCDEIFTQNYLLLELFGMTVDDS